MASIQKNPLLLVALAYAIGICCAAVLPTPGLWLLAFSSLATLGLYLGMRGHILPRIQAFVMPCFLFCFLQAGWLLGDISAKISPADPSNFTGKEMVVEGMVLEDAVATQKGGFRVAFQCLTPISGKIALYLPADGIAPHAYTNLRGTVQLQALSDRNPGYTQWLHSQGIHATAKGVDFVETGHTGGFWAMLSDLRRTISQKMQAVMPEANNAGLNVAMMLGDRSALDREVRSDFSATGLSHVLAISGMHLAILYGVLNLLLKGMLFLRHGRQTRSVIVVALLVFFALLTGANAAVCRAAIMIGLLDLAQAFWQKNNSLNALAIAGLCFLIFDPQALFTPGFQLSYAAVLGILLLQGPILKYLHARIKRLPAFVGTALAVTLAAQIATTPLVVWHFHTFPTYFLLANTVMLPVVALATQIGFAGLILIWIPGVSEVWGGILDFLLWMLTVGADLLANLPGATITSLRLNEIGLWVLLGQVMLAFIGLERKFLRKALQGFRKGGRLQTASAAGLQARAMGIAALLIWVLGGFLL
jgi:ComEC/Rec2-related protein